MHLADMALNRKDVFFFLTIVLILYTLLGLRNEIKMMKNVNITSKPLQNLETDSNCDKYGFRDQSFSCIVKMEKFKENLRGQASIPKIIHQIWNDEIIPGEFVNNIRSLVRDNPAPDWKYYWWTKESGMKLMKDKFPNLVTIVDGLSDIMRADILRYLVVYEYGGVYFDLDTVSVKSLNNFVDSHRCSLALEPPEHYFQVSAQGNDFFLSNGAFLCLRKHPFFANLMLHIYRLPKSCTNAFLCTGPPMLSWFYKEFNKSDGYSGELPDVQSSEVFQDVYDDRYQRKLLDHNCFNNSKILPHQIKICENWIARGKEKRKLSDQALTYHTWFHIGNRKLHISNENHVKKVVPHAGIYGQDFFLL